MDKPHTAAPSRVERENHLRYARAAERFKALERSLDAALDRLQSARAAQIAANIPPIYKEVQQLELEAARAWEAMEQARQAYWNQKAVAAEAALIDAALPLIAAIEHCRRAGGSFVMHGGLVSWSRIASLPRPAFACSDSTPPIEIFNSDVLDRAESEIQVLRGNAVH